MILSALCPLLCNYTRPQHTLLMFADNCGPRQTIPWETINQGTASTTRGAVPYSDHIQPSQPGSAPRGFVWVSTRQLAVSSLSKGISSTLNFHESIGTDGTQTRNKKIWQLIWRLDILINSCVNTTALTEVSLIFWDNFRETSFDSCMGGVHRSSKYLMFCSYGLICQYNNSWRSIFYLSFCGLEYIKDITRYSVFVYSTYTWSKKDEWVYLPKGKSPGGRTDLERGYEDVRPWRPPFHAAPVVCKGPILSKRVSSQDPLLRKFGNFSLYSPAQFLPKF